MKSRFKRELHEFLIQDEISLESNIINELIYQMIGVKVDDEDNIFNSDYGFKLSTHSWQKEDKREQIKFTLPKLTMPQLLKHLDFFHLPHESYITNTALILNDQFIVDKLLPAFKAYYQQLKMKDPFALIKYKIQSKSILESSAISTLREYTQKAIDTIMPDELIGASEEAKPIIDEMILLEAKVNRINAQPTFYHDIIASRSKLEKLLTFPIVSKQEKLTQQLKLILEGIDLFTKYHRFESIIANKNFRKEIEKFLIDNHNISDTQCDVVEHLLLRLAQAKLGVEGKCQFKEGSDKSRLVFTFNDMTKDNAERVVSYLRELGDETANEGFGSRKYGSSIPEPTLKCASFTEQQCYEIKKSEKTIESHHVETDGNFFYNKIFPLLKNEIRAMELSEKTTLDHYRKASQKYLLSLGLISEIKVSQNKSTLFQEAMPMDIEKFPAPSKTFTYS